MSHTRSKNKKNRFNYTDEELDQLANKHGLWGVRKKMFLDYIKERGFTRRDYYTDEWAERFKEGSEWEKSDSEGRKILKKLMKKHYGIE